MRGEESFSDAERAEGWRAYADLNESLTASGEMVISEALADPSQGRRLPADEFACHRPMSCRRAWRRCSACST